MPIPRSEYYKRNRVDLRISIAFGVIIGNYFIRIGLCFLSGSYLEALNTLIAALGNKIRIFS